MSDAKTASRQVIVSGATGFVGQHMVPLLLANGYEVIATARDEAKAKAFPWFSQVRFEPLDFHKHPPHFPIAKGATLIHLAWQGLPQYNALSHLEDNLPHNYGFIKTLVENGVERVLVAGTCFEYGLQNGPIPSSAPTHPNTPYALAKDTLRQCLEYLAKAHPFTLQWARLFYMYGAGQHPKSILPLLDAAMAENLPVFNMSGGEQLRDYLPVEEVARQLLDIVETRDAGTYNVCSGTPISVRRLVEERIAQTQGTIKPNLGFYPYPAHEPMAFWGVRDMGQTLLLPSLPNMPMAAHTQTQPLGPVRLRHQKTLNFIENEAFNPDLIAYTPDYQNRQAGSAKFVAHMNHVLGILKAAFPRGAKLVDVGCGKGDFVELAQADGHFKVTGYDFAYEGDNPAIEKRFLTEADRIEADVVVLRHVLEHMQKPHTFVALLATIFPRAKIYIEVPNFDWIAQHQSFFDITYEHVNYFTQTALKQLFVAGHAQAGLCFEDQYQYVLADLNALNPAFGRLYEAPDWHYLTFQNLFPHMMKQIAHIEAMAQNNAVYIWGAATKGCLFLAHCANLGRLQANLKFAIDINPDKIGKFLPGSGLPVKDKQSFFAAAKPGDVLLVANPAYKAEIEQEVRQANLPQVTVLALS